MTLTHPKRPQKPQLYCLFFAGLFASVACGGDRFKESTDAAVSTSMVAHESADADEVGVDDSVVSDDSPSLDDGADEQNLFSDDSDVDAVDDAASANDDGSLSSADDAMETDATEVDQQSDDSEPLDAGVNDDPDEVGVDTPTDGAGQPDAAVAMDDGTPTDDTATDDSSDDTTTVDTATDDTATDDSSDDTTTVDTATDNTATDDTATDDTAPDDGTTCTNDTCVANDAGGPDVVTPPEESGAPDPPPAEEAGAPVNDECPEHPEQSERGSCGCGHASDPVCEFLESSLAHRYSFKGSGTVAFDSVGDADGGIVGTTLNGEGQLELSGTGDYVNLPSGIISALGSATFETWLIWHGGSAWQRIFDFGNLSVTGGSFGGWGGWGGTTSSPDTYLFLTPLSSNTPAGITASWTSNGESAAQFIDTGTDCPIDELIHIVLVADDDDAQMRVYLNGDLLDSAVLLTQMSEIDDQYNRLGRSLFTDDPDLNGVLEEFRIYDAALTAAEIQMSLELGPNATFSAQP